MKILVVENEIIVADNILKVLSKLGYDVLEPALNYEQAVLSIRRNRPDFMILDINLGKEKTGIDVAHYLKEKDNIPFIFLTAYADENTLEKAIKTNPSGYLIKPFSKADIKPSIEVALVNFNLRNKKTPKDQFSLLTNSELAVAKLIAKKKTTKEIAETLELSRSTIKNHRHHICSKLDLPPTNNSLLSWVMLHHDELIGM